MHTNDSNRFIDSAEPGVTPAVGPIRIVALHAPDGAPQRRRMPRRQIIATFAVERRRADRRQAKPGLDGLLRMVLADDWM